MGIMHYNASYEWAPLACMPYGTDPEDPNTFNIPIYGHVIMYYTHIWSYDHVSPMPYGTDPEDQHV